MTAWLIEIVIAATEGREAEHVTIRTEAEYGWQAVFNAARGGHLPPGPCTITVSEDK